MSKTYPNTNNYWTPLSQETEEDEDDTDEEMNNTHTINNKPTGNKWTRQKTRRQQQLRSNITFCSGSNELTKHGTVEQNNILT